MPGLNRKGPNGEGPMSGRKMGRCNPANKGKTEEEIMQTRNEIPSKNENGQGLGYGRANRQGLGRGMGRAHRFRGNQ